MPQPIAANLNGASTILAEAFPASFITFDPLVFYRLDYVRIVPVRGNFVRLKASLTQKTTHPGSLAHIGSQAALIQAALIIHEIKSFQNVVWNRFTINTETKGYLLTFNIETSFRITRC